MIILPKTYVAERCRIILAKIDALRARLVKTAFIEACNEYYPEPDTWRATFRRFWDEWPDDRPETTPVNLKDFVEYKLTTEEQILTAFVCGAQYHICSQLLHAATLPQPGDTLTLTLDEYEKIADHAHIP